MTEAATVEVKVEDHQKKDPQSKYAKQALALKNEALAVKAILSNDEYLTVCERGRLTAALDKEIEAFFKGLKDPAYAAWKNICATENEIREPLKEAKSNFSRVIGEYQSEQERLRQEEQRRLEAEARKQEQENRIAEAVALAEQGKTEEADEVFNTEPVVSAPVVAPRTVPTVKGVSGRTNWEAQVTDVKTLIAAVAAGKVPLMALEPNMTFLNNQARQMKGLLAYPGVKAVPKSGTTFRK